MKNEGDWANNSWNIPEYRLSVFLKAAIYVGGGAGIISLVALFQTLHLQPAPPFELIPTLSSIVITLVLLEIVAVLAGIKYFAEGIS